MRFKNGFVSFNIVYVLLNICFYRILMKYGKLFDIVLFYIEWLVKWGRVFLFVYRYSVDFIVFVKVCVWV